MDIYTLAEIGIVGGISLAALREVRIILIKRPAVSKITKADAKAPFQGLTGVIEHVDDILGQLYKMRDEMIGKNVSKDQLQPIESRIKWLERVKDNKQWLQYIAPQVDGVVDAALKWVQKALK